MEHGKDTWQMLTSGAGEAAWVRSKRSDLPDLLPKALKRLSHLDLIIVEGNSAIEFLKPYTVKFKSARRESAESLAFKSSQPVVLILS